MVSTSQGKVLLIILGKRMKPEVEARRKWVAAYGRARYEHAYMLRQEGLTFRKAGQYLGVTGERIRHMVMRESRRLERLKWDDDHARY